MSHAGSSGTAFFGSALVVGFTRAAKNISNIPRNLTETGGLQLIEVLSQASAIEYSVPGPENTQSSAKYKHSDVE